MFIRRTAIFLLTSVLFLSIGISACDSPTSRPLTRSKSNPPAPAFVLYDIEGKPHALPDYLGKVVVVNFWASWCPPCVSEMPSLQKAAGILAQHDIFVLGINVGEPRSSVMRFLGSTPITFTLLLDTKSEVSQSWAVPLLPTTIVLGRDGRIALLAVGERDWSESTILQQIISLKGEQ